MRKHVLVTVLLFSGLALGGAGDAIGQQRPPMGPAAGVGVLNPPSGVGASNPASGVEAATVVAAILAGQDDPEAWGALEEALGTSGDGDLVPDGAALPGGFELPTWLEPMATPRVLAGVLAALVAVLLMAAARVVVRAIIRGARAVAPRPRRGRTLVRRGSGHRPARDAERLHAQLRARRVA